jgi:ATP-dependent helicase HrpA
MDQIRLLASPLCSGRELERQLAELIADRSFLDEDSRPHNADEFQQLLVRGRERIGLGVQDVTRLVLPLLGGFQQVRLTLEEARSPNWQFAVEDLREQLAELTAGETGFFIATPWRWLQQYPRYFRAMTLRLDKIAGSGWQRDRRAFADLEPFLDAYRARVADHRRRGIFDPALAEFRWLLEEFRVSLFAQELGTIIPVSAKRLEKHWANVTI